MASVCKQGGGRRLIQINELPNRPKVRLGKISNKDAQSIRIHIESIITTKKAGLPLDHETALWLGKIDNEFYDKLASLSLVIEKDHQLNVMKLHDFLEKYISSRADLKFAPSSITEQHNEF